MYLVELHCLRVDIESLINQQVSTRKIADIFGLSKSTVYRHAVKMKQRQRGLLQQQISNQAAF
jgi:DNA invertase Pin-like site-specific DNA recombinase